MTTGKLRLIGTGLSFAAGLSVATQAAADQLTPPDALQDIVVTGSRIRRPDFEAPNPIVSFNAPISNSPATPTSPTSSSVCRR